MAATSANCMKAWDAVYFVQVLVLSFVALLRDRNGLSLLFKQSFILAHRLSVAAVERAALHPHSAPL